MRILSITAQKPGSTGSGVYLTELVKELAVKGHEQAVVAGVYEDDVVELPEGVKFFPVYFAEDMQNQEFCEGEPDAGCCEGESDAGLREDGFGAGCCEGGFDAGRCEGESDAGCCEGGFVSGLGETGSDVPFPIAGMSDEMPYKSTRYRDMTPEMAEQFKAAFLKAVTRAVKELSPDVVLCHHLYLLTALVREAFPELKVYGFCHNTDLRQMKKTDLKRDFIREQVRRLDHIFVPQRAQEEGVKEIYGVPADGITRAGMGFNRRIFHVTGEKPSDGTVRIVFAGKIAEKKGVVSLMRSLCLLDAPGREVEVLLAGSTGNEEELLLIRELAGKAPVKVTFLGRLSQTELSKVYNLCDIFVLPSFFEGIPLTVIEALACGDRVVMTDLPGIREWLSETVPGADVLFVKMPEMQNADEPVASELPEFEKRLAAALSESIRKGETRQADVSGISWEGIAARVIDRVCG